MARRRREAETAQITSLTHDGRGIAALQGKKVFVAGALSGETVRFIRRKSRRNFDEAELLEVVEASPQRIEARCAVFGRCGGCVLQHVDIEQQREIKFQVLKDNLQRIGKVEAERWLTPIGGPDWHYRRRGRLAVKDVAGKGRVLVGFRERHAPFITDMHRCEVLAQPVHELIDPLSELIGGLSIRARLPQIEVAVADNAVALVFRVLDPPTEADKSALEAFAMKRAVRVYLQPGGLDSVTLLAGEDSPLTYTLDDFSVTIAFDPVGFVQINRDVNEQMVSLAIELLDIEPGHRALDLFCGIGNFSLPLARRCKEVLGVELDPLLVKAASKNARDNGINNVDFRVADLATVDGSEAWLKGSCERLLLDPARSGAADVVANIEAIGARRIVYVSCHPGTLARDAGLLVNDKGYRLEAAGIIDMFPHTAHIESIAVFNK